LSERLFAALFPPVSSYPPGNSRPIRGKKRERLFLHPPTPAEALKKALGVPARDGKKLPAKEKSRGQCRQIDFRDEEPFRRSLWRSRPSPWARSAIRWSSGFSRRDRGFRFDSGRFAKCIIP
jgi:hypothetical protein